MFKISIPYLYDIIYRYKDYEGQAQTIRNTLQSLSASEVEYFRDYFALVVILNILTRVLDFNDHVMH